MKKKKKRKMKKITKGNAFRKIGNGENNACQDQMGKSTEEYYEES